MDRKRLRSYRCALWLACGLYVAACALPATKWWGNKNMGGGGVDHYVTEFGLACLMWGWTLVVSAFQEGAWDHLTWLANPLALVGVALLLLRRPTGAAAFGAASVILGASYLIAPPRPPRLPALAAGRRLALGVQLVGADDRRADPPKTRADPARLRDSGRMRLTSRERRASSASTKPAARAGPRGGRGPRRGSPRRSCPFP